MNSNKRFLYWAAGLSIFSLVAHAIDAPDHLVEWWGYGTFFVIIAAFQFFFGLALLLQPWKYDAEGKIREDANLRGRPYFILGLSLSAANIIFYAVTRTSGIPFFGPEAGREPVTVLSLVPVIVNLPLLFFLAKLALQTNAQAHPQNYPPGQIPV
jgi:hypothetical protein